MRSSNSKNYTYFFTQFLSNTIEIMKTRFKYGIIKLTYIVYVTHRLLDQDNIICNNNNKNTSVYNESMFGSIRCNSIEQNWYFDTIPCINLHQLLYSRPINCCITYANDQQFFEFRINIRPELDWASQIHIQIRNGKFSEYDDWGHFDHAQQVNRSCIENHRIHIDITINVYITYISMHTIHIYKYTIVFCIKYSIDDTISLKNGRTRLCQVSLCWLFQTYLTNANWSKVLR